MQPQEAFRDFFCLAQVQHTRGTRFVDGKQALLEAIGTVGRYNDLSPPRGQIAQWPYRHTAESHLLLFYVIIEETRHLDAIITKDVKIQFSAISRAEQHDRFLGLFQLLQDFFTLIIYSSQTIQHLFHPFKIKLFLAVSSCPP